MESLFKITNKEDSKVLDLFIFDVIDDFWGVGKTAILNELQNNTFNEINLQISSPGGSVDDAFAMFDLIKGSKAHVTANLSGIVASAATVIALSADKVIMSENSLFMIHNASVGLQGNKEEMAEAIEVMNKFDGRIANIYQKKTGLPLDEIKDLMTAETWFTAEEALAKGFVDEISEEGLRLAAKFDLNAIQNRGFKNIPNNIKEIINNNNNNDMELKDVFNNIISAFENKGVEITDEHKALISEVENSIKEQFENSLKESEVTNSELKSTIETLEANAKIVSDLEATLESITESKNDLTAKVAELESKLAIDNSVETPATPEADANLDKDVAPSYMDSLANVLKNKY